MGTKAGLPNMSRRLFLFSLFDPAKTRGMRAPPAETRAGPMWRWELLRGLGVDRGIRTGEEGRVRTREAEAILGQA